MSKEFKRLTIIKKSKLNMDELCEYERARRNYLANSDKKLKGVVFRKIVHPVINAAIKSRRLKLKQTLTVYNSVKKVDRPIIFAVTHTGKYDIEIVNEAIKKSYYLLSDDEEYMYRTIDGYFTIVNGVIYVDSDYKSDMQNAKKISKKVLNQNGNIMWYPEAIWNLSPNELMLPCRYGIIETAVETNAVILPIAIDQKDKDFYVNIGEYIYPEELNLKGLDDREGKIKGINLLRDKMATLKWEIWEKQGVYSRDEIPFNYQEKYVEEKIAEWPFLSQQDIEKRIYKPSNMVSFEDVLVEPIIRKKKNLELEKEKLYKIADLLEKDENLTYDEAEKIIDDFVDKKYVKQLKK